MLREYYSRIVIAGLAGDSGKTIVSCGLLSSFKSRGVNVTGFKKGPDYIDAAWLSLASGKPARNLDSFMMGFPEVKNSFLKRADKNGINIIEGNRGLFDGVNNKGTHSTAELASLLKAPVIIVQDISKVTRTAAASILGCVNLDRNINIVGVILNRAASERHSKIAKDAIEGETGIPVLGIIPKLPEKYILPERHLGLIMPEE
ncbi:MAG TPA: AAA family ATPase, partial [Ignavibacteriaceae bacterium]|nr:AAA family ATPase [Ignavibacteriaceae bacterium]